MGSGGARRRVVQEIQTAAPWQSITVILHLSQPLNLRCLRSATPDRALTRAGMDPLRAISACTVGERVHVLHERGGAELASVFI